MIPTAPPKLDLNTLHTLLKFIQQHAWEALSYKFVIALCRTLIGQIPGAFIHRTWVLWAILNEHMLKTWEKHFAEQRVEEEVKVLAKEAVHAEHG
jgi:hypothetical protein